MRCAIAFLCLATIPAFAGICVSDPIPNDPRDEFQFFAGYSPGSINGGVKWRTKGRRYGVEAGYKFLHIR